MQYCLSWYTRNHHTRFNSFLSGHVVDRGTAVCRSVRQDGDSRVSGLIGGARSPKKRENAGERMHDVSLGHLASVGWRTIYKQTLVSVSTIEPYLCLNSSFRWRSIKRLRPATEVLSSLRNGLFFESLNAFAFFYCPFWLLAGGFGDCWCTFQLPYWACRRCNGTFLAGFYPLHWPLTYLLLIQIPCSGTVNGQFFDLSPLTIPVNSTMGSYTFKTGSCVYFTPCWFSFECMDLQTIDCIAIDRWIHNVTWNGRGNFSQFFVGRHIILISARMPPLRLAPSDRACAAALPLCVRSDSLSAAMYDGFILLCDHSRTQSFRVLASRVGHVERLWTEQVCVHILALVLMVA